MKKVSIFIKSPYFLIFVLGIVNLSIAFFLIKQPLNISGDSLSYFNAMKFLQGQEYNTQFNGPDTEIVLKARILTTPLMLYSSIFFGKIIGNEYDGMLLINIIFYFLIIFVFYKLIYAIYKDHFISLISSVLFMANYCLYHYGTTYRTDIGGWFFFLLATLLAVKYFKNPQINKFYYLAILSASIGVLFKEYGALGLISLCFLILFFNVAFWEKIKKIFKAGILFSIIPGLYHLFFLWKFNYSYFHWHSYAFSEVINNPAAPGIDWSILLLAKVLGWLFLAGWPIFAWGLYQEYKNFDKQRIKILLAILPASLSFLAWPGLTQRIAFILVPWLAMISGYGLSKIKSKYLIVFILLIYALVNYLTRPWLLSMINL
ncbi:glycosyltransferase family 39 protein [Patescibacteria group bacterium]|nr:glycosyltransferase family 39 protein [Patescibacteria group bacterium]